MLLALWLFTTPIPQCDNNCAVSPDGIALISSFEGYSPFIYKDAVGLPTIGFGHLVKPGERFKEPLLGDDADNLLRNDVKWTESAVNKFVIVPLWQNQADALCSWTYNLGSRSLQNSNMLRKVNANRHDEVPPEMLKWVNAGGKRLKGLVLRRMAEGELYDSNPK